MNNYIEKTNEDPSLTPHDILSFTKVANKVLDMLQPGLILQPGLKFSIGATSTQTRKEPASFSDSTAEPKPEVAYRGSFASFQPVPSASNEHFAALANLDTIKEDSYRCMSPFSIGSS